MTKKRKKIAVIGGGMSALTAVYQLTKTKDWHQKYDITIYQMGWRIGGKGASGRNMQVGKRIEEHGLHIWFGFYTNAFNLIKEVYEKADTTNSPFKSYKDAFTPHSYIPLMEHINKKWEVWGLHFPENAMEPAHDSGYLPLWEYVKMALETLLIRMRKSEALFMDMQKATSDESASRRRIFFSSFAYNTMLKIRKGLENAKLITFRRAEKMLENMIDEIGKNKQRIFDVHSLANQHLRFLINFWKWVKNQIGNLIYMNASLRHSFILFDIVFTIIDGMLHDDIFRKGLDSINHIEFRDWMRKHGASEITLNSALITALYDVGFAYLEGDINKPSYEAGSAIRIIIRLMFDYKGAFMWKMQSGMGDTIFTPIYQLFNQYAPSEQEGGIRFEFFHKAKNLGLSQDKKRIETITFDVQATPKDNKPYKPLVNVKGLECWPSEPDYDQLEQGEELKRQNINLESFWTPWKGEELTLRAGEDFDEVILGTPVGTLPWICPELIAANPRWQTMIDNVKTTQTQAYQLWFNKTIREMGWKYDSPVMTSFAEPVDTWADMSHLIDTEEFPEGYEPKNIAYYCGVFKDAHLIPPPDDHQFPQREHERVKTGFREYLKNDLPYVFPNFKKADGTMNWDTLIDLENQTGEKRLDSQYWRANIDPNERYTLTNVNSSIHRLKTNETGFDNLYITGDWIQTNFNYGCIECCVMAGMMTARAVSGEPVYIIGEDHI